MTGVDDAGADAAGADDAGADTAGADDAGADTAGGAAVGEDTSGDVTAGADVAGADAADLGMVARGGEEPVAAMQGSSHRKQPAHPTLRTRARSRGKGSVHPVARSRPRLLEGWIGADKPPVTNMDTPRGWGDLRPGNDRKNGTGRAPGREGTGYNRPDGNEPKRLGRARDPSRAEAPGHF